MINLIYLFLMTFMFSFLLILMNFIMSKKNKLNREKNSPFECGFDPLINLMENSIDWKI